MPPEDENTWCCADSEDAGWGDKNAEDEAEITEPGVA